MSTRFSLFALLCALLLAGCPTNTEPGDDDDATANDDDSSGDDDDATGDDDDATGDDDDATGDDDDATGDDDDATGDDDDATGDDDDSSGDDDDATGDDDDATEPVDADGDGSPEGTDCDDADPANYPGNTELCDGQDNDCANGADADAAGEVDGDSDGSLSCEDCDDADGANYPGNTELCDGADNDCANGADADAAGEVDGDSDGSLSCEDCDDADGANYPGNTELCDGADNDCANGADADAAGEVDGDSDGSLSCEDCDDADGANYPGNTELCDGADNDCANGADADAAGEVDGDSDGSLSCVDCDDADGANYPGNTELCDGADNDCNGSPDADAAGEVDGDSDGSLSCVDCDDADGANYPGNTELCDGLDNDCNGSADADVGGEVDGDGDGSLSCDDCDDGDINNVPGGTEICDGQDNDCDGTTIFLGEATDFDGDSSIACLDCDDSDANNYPGNTELCDGADNDCSGSADADAAGEVDGDGDGSLSCDDCDDGDINNVPGGTEICDGQDNDCDASTSAGDGETDDDGDLTINCDDCDDVDPNVNPGATEFCDGVDTNCDGGVATEFDTGPTSFNSSSANGMRGNVFLPVENTLLNGFSQRLTAAAGQTLTWAVYESTTLGGPYDLVDSHTTEVAAADAGAQVYHQSLAFGIELEQGTYYGLVTYWTESTSYSFDTLGGAVSAGAWGSHEGSLVQQQSLTGLPTNVSNGNSGNTYPMIVTVNDEGDVDNDGALACEDCDDDAVAVFPGAVEVCNGEDDDCTGTIDLGTQSITDAPAITITTVGNVSYSSDIVVPSGGMITDVNVTIDITHTWDEDLDISLISPLGTEVELTSDNGGSGNNYTGTVFDDAASTPITSGSPPFTGSFQPEEPLANFNGENAAGTWTLVVFDDTGADGGTWNSWTLDIQTAMSDGAEETCPAIDCDDILTADALATDGLYWVDPGGVGAWQTFCDMTSDDGGWTLVANVDDLNDPFFGGDTVAPYYEAAWIDAWEGTGVRNMDQVPTFIDDVAVSTKYPGWSEMNATDLRIAYKNDGASFVCEGLSLVQPLSTTFASTPGSGACSAACSSFTQDRFLTDIPLAAGLNCNDGNQGWYTSSQVAENARIGGYGNNSYYYGFLGAMGDRSPAAQPYERSWWGFAEAGVEQDTNIMVFVR